ncbi:MAG: radical SAM/SPASM domain-containing protein [Thermodesulfovibrio sp.]|nr:radical SAM/SPASM domain-containing protein [Thermodesulfovibrio sp.]
MIEYVQFFPTLRCNKACDFCFSKSLFYDDLPENKIEYLINFLNENDIKNLDILGGEPFLYKPFTKLIEKALEKDLEITISTNGTLTKEIRAFLKNFGNSRVKVGISINDFYDNELLELVEEHRLWIKSLVIKDKIPEIRLIEFAKNLGIKYYLIYMDALTEKDLEKTTPFYQFMEIVEELNNSFPNIEPVFCKGFIGGLSDYRCPAGSEKISIMPDGSVYPCYLLAGFKDYKLGNIFKDSLSDILKSKKLEIFKKNSGNICHNKICKFHKKCRGGCVAHSIIHYRNNTKPDPRCNINK